MVLEPTPSLQEILRSEAKKIDGQKGAVKSGIIYNFVGEITGNYCILVNPISPINEGWGFSFLRNTCLENVNAL